MNRLLSFVPLLGIAALVAGCASQQANVEVVGVPEWIASGAKLSDEPEPLRPDPAIIHHESESGPVELRIFTDRETYPDPPKKRKTRSRPEPDPIERGREYRIKRLFR